MAGKIFPDSANTWQDQAKVLFNYYRQAAERVVGEEERIEHEIAALEQEKAALEKQLGDLWWWFLTIILFFVYFIKKSNIEKQIQMLDARIAEFQQQWQQIFRDYRVKRLGVAYVPVAEQVKYQDKSFVVDFTGDVPEQKISMSVSRQNELLVDTIRNLDALAKEAPVVETSDDTETVDTDEYSLSIQEVKENDYLGALERSLRTVAFCMDDLDTTSVTLPVVLDGNPYLDRLDEYATPDAPQGAPVVEVFDRQAYEPGIERFREINQLKNSLSDETSRFEDVLRQLMMTIAQSVQTLSALKVASVDKVVLDSNRVLYQILKSPYNHYSPVLEMDEIQRIREEKFDYSEDVQGYEPFQLRPSSRVRFNPVSGTWVAEDGSQTVVPFGVHQLYEEIVAPMVQNLMAENRIERLKIYNHIRDQKLSYLNKWHQDTDAFYRANRAESADIINLMQGSLREYVAAYNTLISLKRTEESMENSGDNLDSTVVEAADNSTESLAAFELQSKEFQKVQSDFEEYMERLKEDIDLKAERFGHVKYYDAQLRDGYSNEVAVAASEVGEMDDRRKTLAAVNPKLAKDSELPPEPNVSDLTHEHFALNLTAMAREALENLDRRVHPEPDNEPVSAPEGWQQEENGTPTVPFGTAPAEETPAEEAPAEAPAPAQEPMHEEPAAEQPAAEQPADEAPVAEEPVAGQPAPEMPQAPEMPAPPAVAPEMPQAPEMPAPPAGPQMQQQPDCAWLMWVPEQTKPQVVQLVQQMFGLGAEDALDLVESAPSMIFSDLAQDPHVPEINAFFQLGVRIQFLPAGINPTPEM